MAWLRLGTTHAYNLDCYMGWEYDPGDGPPTEPPVEPPASKDGAAPVLHEPNPPTLILHAADTRKDVVLTGDEAITAHAYLVATVPSA